MPVITISRGIFCSGRNLAENVSAELGYPCVAEEVLVKAASQYHVSVKRLIQNLEERPRFFEGLGLERVHTVAFVRAALVKEIQDEKLVYHGLAGHLLLRDAPNTLKIRVLADMEHRIKTAMERLGVSRDEAIAYIRKVDADRRSWTKFLFHVDPLDLSLYDMVINLEQMSLGAACDAVYRTATSPEFQPTPESRKKLRDLILATEVRARIAADGGIHDENIEITAEDGVITISGSARSVEDADRVRLVARNVLGVREIVSRLNVPVQTHLRVPFDES